MTRERVLSHLLAGPEQGWNMSVEGSNSAAFPRHADVRNAILIIDLSHRRKTEVGVKSLQVRLRPKVNRLLRPVPLTAGQRLRHQLMAKLFAARGGADDNPANHHRIVHLFAFKDPRISHQFAIAPAEKMAILPNQIIAVDILISALLLHDKDFAAQLQQRIQLGNGEFTMMEILPGHHLLLLIDILILCDSP